MCARGRAQILTQEAIDRMRIPGGRYVFRELAVFKSDLSEEDQRKVDPARVGFRSDFFTIALIRSGNVSARIDHKEYRLSAGDVTFAGPHRIKQMVGANTECEIHAILFTVEFLKRLKMGRITEQLALFSTAELPVLHLDANERAVLEAAITRLEQRIDAVHEHTFGTEMVVNAFADLLLELGHIGYRKGDVQPNPIGRKEELVAGFAQLMQQHYIEQRQLGFYSERLFVTTKHLSETVKEITGRTAGQLIDDILLVESRRMLDDTGLSIAEVADRLRFPSPAQFSKFFHRTTGASPRDYRKSMIKSTS